MSSLASERLPTLPRPVLEALRAELGPRFVNEQQCRLFDSQAAEVLYSGAFRALATLRERLRRRSFSHRVGELSGHIPTEPVGEGRAPCG